MKALQIFAEKIGIMKSVYLRNKGERMAAKAKANISGFEGEKGRHVIGFGSEESWNGVEMVFFEARQWILEIEFHFSFC